MDDSSPDKVNKLRLLQYQMEKVKKLKDDAPNLNKVVNQKRMEKN